MAELDQDARNTEIIQKVMDTLEEDYASDSPESLEAKFNEFAKEHSAMFQGDFDDEATEQKLEYTEAFNKYQKIFESTLEAIVAKCGVSAEEFSAALTSKQKNDNDATFGTYNQADSFIGILVSIADYKTFLNMMRNFKDQHD